MLASKNSVRLYLLGGVKGLQFYRRHRAMLQGEAKREHARKSNKFFQKRLDETAIHSLRLSRRTKKGKGYRVQQLVTHTRRCINCDRHMHGWWRWPKCRACIKGGPRNIDAEV